MPDPAPMAGLGTLAALKAELLPGALAAQPGFDALILSTGKAVAALFEGHCGRKLVRRVGAVYETAATVSYVQLDAYPVESIDALGLNEYPNAPTELRVVDYVRAVNAEAGIVELWGAGGSRVFGNGNGRLRFTYTGGFWPDDGGEKPAGASPVPDDLLSAWILQSAALFEARNAIGVGTVRDAKDGLASGALSEIKLLPVVVDMLAPYVCAAKIS